jgi:hypothetical protein
MPCPLLIGMNPSPNFVDEPWHLDADSTKVLAEFALGDPDMTWCLSYGLDMDNLNGAIPPKEDGEIVVDEVEARQRLDGWARDGRLKGRDVVLVGDAVARVFCDWAEVRPLDNRSGQQRRTSRKVDGGELSLIRIPHPGRILRLRNERSELLEWTERRFAAVGGIYRDGEAINAAVVREIDLQIMLDDQKVADELAIHESNMLSDMEDAAEMHEHRVQLRRQDMERLRWEPEDDDKDEWN